MQEIEPYVGESLIKFWDRSTSHQGKPSTPPHNNGQYPGKKVRASPEGVHGGQFSGNDHGRFYNRPSSGGFPFQEQGQGQHGGYPGNQGSQKGYRGQDHRVNSPGMSPMNQGMNFNNYGGYHSGGFQGQEGPQGSEYGQFNHHQRSHGGQRRGNHNRQGNRK